MTVIAVVSWHLDAAALPCWSVRLVVNVFTAVRGYEVAWWLRT